MTIYGNYCLSAKLEEGLLQVVELNLPKVIDANAEDTEASEVKFIDDSGRRG